MVSSSLVASMIGFAAADVNDLNVTLNNGVQMPKLAFAAQVWSGETCKDATSLAIQAGFRFIWSSVLVGDECQNAQGQAIANSDKRSELFIAGTVNSGSCSGIDGCYDQTKNGADGQFAVLGVDYLDMLMLDYPTQGCDGIAGQWKAFEEFLAGGRVGTIAVSNFSPDQIQCITANTSATVPAVNQLHYSVGSKGTMIEDNAKFGVQVQSYSPLNSGQLIRDADTVSIGQGYNKSGAQIALKWILQTKGTVATQSTSLKHLQEDMAIFDFAMTEAELAQLSAKGAQVMV